MVVHYGLREVKLEVEVLILVKDQLLGLRRKVRLLKRILKREIRHRIVWTIGLMSEECRLGYI